MRERVAAALGVAVQHVEPVAGGDICRAGRATLADGQAVFVKSLPGAPARFFASEADGLRWLAEAGAPVPEVLAVADDLLVLEWIEAGRWSPATDETAGRAVAVMHAAGAPAFGSRDGADGWIATVPLPGEPAPDWPTLWADARIRPLVRRLRDEGGLDADGAANLDTLCDRLPALAGPAEPPARLHGDLWSGNLLADDRGQPWLVDPAAHGGHRETDLAMLALFGGLTDRFVAAYEEVTPLAEGWRHRQSLHQLHPLLVHAVLFGGAYAARAVAIARRYA
jgi:fructosamine-3-kinase